MFFYGKRNREVVQRQARIRSFIAPEDGGKDLLSTHNIAGDGFKSLTEGAKVEFESREGAKGPRGDERRRGRLVRPVRGRFGGTTSPEEGRLSPRRSQDRDGGRGHRGPPQLRMYRIELDNGHETLGYMAGRMKRFRIRI